MKRRDLLELRERRSRFSAWERTAPQARFPGDLHRRIAWYEAAWRLAERFDPTWNRKGLPGEHVRHIMHVRSRLAKLGRHGRD